MNARSVALAVVTSFPRRTTQGIALFGAVHVTSQVGGPNPVHVVDHRLDQTQRCSRPSMDLYDDGGSSRLPRQLALHVGQGRPRVTPIAPYVSHGWRATNFCASSRVHAYNKDEGLRTLPCGVDRNRSRLPSNLVLDVSIVWMFLAETWPEIVGIIRLFNYIRS